MPDRSSTCEDQCIIGCPRKDHTIQRTRADRIFMVQGNNLKFLPRTTSANKPIATKLLLIMIFIQTSTTSCIQTYAIKSADMIQLPSTTHHPHPIWVHPTWPSIWWRTLRLRWRWAIEIRRRTLAGRALARWREVTRKRREIAIWRTVGSKWGWTLKYRCQLAGCNYKNTV
jgi:hypothetical protein